MDHNSITNKHIVLDCSLEDDIYKTKYFIEKLITDGYSVTVHPYSDLDGKTEFVTVEIFDEDLSADDYFNGQNDTNGEDKHNFDDETILDYFHAIRGLDNRISDLEQERHDFQKDMSNLIRNLNERIDALVAKTELL